MGSTNPPPKATGHVQKKKDLRPSADDLSEQQLERLKRSVCKNMPEISFVSEGKWPRH